MTKDQTIGVFFGSRSPEHDISIITAQLIISGLKGLGYNLVPIYLTKKGEWLLGDELSKLKTFTDPGRDSARLIGSKYRKYFLDLEESVGQLVFRKKGPFGRFFGGRVVIDLAFPAFHGSFGEDGTIQGLFEIFDVPYVGCGVAASAVAMDKVSTKLLYVGAGIPTTKFLHFESDEWSKDKAGILAQIESGLSWPVFVKPARLGSSIGMAKVKTKKDLEFAIEVALHYDSKFLVEESLEDLMDVTCCVIGNENPTSSLLQESLFDGSEFFSYEDKYLKEGGAQLGKAVSNMVIPARLDAQTTKTIRETAVQIYKILGCSGIARIDFLYDTKQKKAYANEINPMPGTVYHHLWQSSGLPLEKLLEKLIELAIKRHQAKKGLLTVFESDILRRLGGAKIKPT